MVHFDELTLKRLLEHAHIGVVIHGWDTTVVYANPTALRLLRLSYEQIIHKDAYDPMWNFVNEAGRKLLTEEYPVNKVRNTRTRLDNEILGVTDSTSEDVTWFLVNAYCEGTLEGESGFIVVTFNDISTTKALFSFRAIVENTQDIVIVTEAEDLEYPTGPKIVYVNKAFEQLTGYSAEEVIGDTPRILQGTLTDTNAKQRIRAALEKGESVSETLLNYDVNGHPYWLEMNIMPLRNRFGDITHFAAIERDVSERKFHQEQLEKRNKDLKALKHNLESIVKKRTTALEKAKVQLERVAYYDPLTNLPNRRYFIDQCERLRKSANRRNASIAFCLLDIDDFKILNDSHGHDIGDAVLVHLAEFFQSLFRADDALCRYGGEEFAFAFTVEKSADVDFLAKRIIAGVEETKVENTNNHSLSVTVSMGITSSLADDNIDIDHELKKADIALYHAKNKGKNCYHLYSEDTPNHCK